jgi:hypothetical protein
MNSHSLGALPGRSYDCSAFDNRHSRPRTFALLHTLDLVKRGDPIPLPEFGVAR